VGASRMPGWLKEVVVARVALVIAVAVARAPALAATDWGHGELDDETRQKVELYVLSNYLGNVWDMRSDLARAIHNYHKIFDTTREHHHEIISVPVPNAAPAATASQGVISLTEVTYHTMPTFYFEINNVSMVNAASVVIDALKEKHPELIHEPTSNIEVKPALNQNQTERRALSKYALRFLTRIVIIYGGLHSDAKNPEGCAADKKTILEEAKRMEFGLGEHYTESGSYHETYTGIKGNIVMQSDEYNDAVSEQAGRKRVHTVNAEAGPSGTAKAKRRKQ